MPSLGIATWDDLAAAILGVIGPAWQITGSADLIWAPFQPDRAGRTDDVLRAADLQNAMADDRVRAIVALRGGAWLVRILERIDFSVLERRKNPVLLIGFSEWTCLSLVAACYPAALSIHHTSPMYMLSTDPDKPLSPEQKQCRWRQIWLDIRALLEGQAPALALAGRLLTPHALPAEPIQLYGGNLTLLAALAGTKYQDALRPHGAWLAMEDVNESIGRIDRKIAQLRMAGLLDDIGGVLLGGFTGEGRDISRDVATLLGVHLPASVPIAAECKFGHFWPAAPFPLRRPVRLAATSAGAADEGVKDVAAGRFEIAIDWPSLV